MNENIICSNT